MQDQFLNFLLFTLTTQGAAIYLLAVLPLGWGAMRTADYFIPVASTSHSLLAVMIFLIEILLFITLFLGFLRLDIMGHMTFFFSDYVKVPK